MIEMYVYKHPGIPIELLLFAILPGHPENAKTMETSGLDFENSGLVNLSSRVVLNIDSIYCIISGAPAPESSSSEIGK